MSFSKCQKCPTFVETFPNRIVDAFEADQNVGQRTNPPSQPTEKDTAVPVRKWLS